SADRRRGPRTRPAGRLPEPTGSLPPPSVRLALRHDAGSALHLQVSTPVIEERHRVVLLVGEAVDASDEEIVVADREALLDRAFQRGDRTVDQRQAGWASVPADAAELVAAGADRRAREAVR